MGWLGRSGLTDSDRRQEERKSEIGGGRAGFSFGSRAGPSHRASILGVGPGAGLCGTDEGGSDGGPD